MIVTDALEMRGAAGAAGSIPRAAVAALSAGADLLCVGADVDRDLIEAVAAEIATATGDGRLDLSRLEGAAARNAALAAWTAAPRGVVADSELGVAAARRAVRVDGSPADLAAPLVVQLVSGYSIAEGRVPWGLRPHLGSAEQIEVVAAGETPESVAARAGSRPIVVVGRRIHSSPAARTLVEKLAADRPVGVVEMGWPSPWRPAGVRAFVVTHGASLANGRAAAEALSLTA